MSDTRILVAEDETISRMDLREMLENLGYGVVGEAGDGVAAVNLARALRPDLVLMDIKMPGLDGISAAQTLAQEHVARGEAIIERALGRPELCRHRIDGHGRRPAQCGNRPRRVQEALGVEQGSAHRCRLSGLDLFVYIRQGRHQSNEEVHHVACK